MSSKSSLVALLLLVSLVCAAPAPVSNEETPENASASAVQPTYSDKHKRAQEKQDDAQWGLARIGQANKLNRGDSSQDWTFLYDPSWGQGVVVYVVDSGIRETHQEIQGRVSAGYVIPRLVQAGQAATDTSDYCNHGTGVASLIAGKKLGIARQATIIPVRIADKTANCAPLPTTNDDCAAGVNWAVQNFEEKQQHSKGGIINLSWTCKQTPATEAAFNAAIKAGIHVVVAIGNSNLNPCSDGGAAPADVNVKDVDQIVVGATNWNDGRFALSNKFGSNFGSCMTLWAPGQAMMTASNVDDTTHITQTGTSVAAPLVAGVIASIISSQGNKSPSEMKNLLLSKAKQNAGIQSLQGSPDVMLQSLMGGPSQRA